MRVALCLRCALCALWWVAGSVHAAFPTQPADASTVFSQTDRAACKSASLSYFYGGVWTYQDGVDCTVQAEVYVPKCGSVKPSALECFSLGKGAQRQVYKYGAFGNGCPANSVLSGGSCTCAAGYVENSSHTGCQPVPNDCQNSAGQPAGIWRYDGGYGADPNPLASEICKSGSGARCIVKVTDPKCTQVRLQGVGNPFWSCRGEAYYTGGWGMGAACDRSAAANGDGGNTPTLPPVTVDPVPDQLPPNTAAPTDCPPGTFEGTVNGTHMCVDDVSNPGQTKSPQTGQEVKKNPDGSTTTTTTEGTTKCSNGSCNTTNNTTTNITGNPNSTCPQGTTPSGPNGSASSCTGVSTSSSTQAQSQFCKENAGSAQCKDGESTFSGSCAGGFICKGDAIQCAMAQEQHRARCDYEKWDAPWKQNGIKDIQASGDISKEFYVNDGSSGNSAWTSWLGSTSVTAACPAGFPMQLLGEQYTLSLQPLCDVGEGARPVVIAVALLLALRTFLSVVTRD